MSLECFYRALIRKNVFLGVVLGMVGGSFSAAAATLAVPGDYETIAAAIAAAGDGDEIVIAAGTYLVEKGAPLVVDKAITLRGADRDTVIVEGNFAETDLPAWDKLPSNTSYDCLLLRLDNAGARVEKITFKKGFANNIGNGFSATAYGYCSGVEVKSGTLADCVVRDCIGGRYGASALALKGDNARAERCRILHNRLLGFNGRTYLFRESGVYVNKGLVTDCEIAYNTGVAAVGLAMIAGMVESTHIHHNEGSTNQTYSASSVPSGLNEKPQLGVGATLWGGTLRNSTIEHNLGGWGVGLYLCNAAAKVENCTIANNIGRAQSMASAGYSYGKTDPSDYWYPPLDRHIGVGGVVVKAGTLSNSIVTNNVSLYWGSAQGLHQLGGTVSGCTFMDNGERGGEHGGNILVEGGTFADDNVVGYTEPEGDGPTEVTVEDGESLADAIASVRCPDGARGRVIVKPQTIVQTANGECLFNLVVKRPVEIVAPEGGVKIDANWTGVPLLMANLDAVIRGFEIKNGKYFISWGRMDSACGVALEMGTLEDCVVHDCTRPNSTVAIVQLLGHGIMRRSLVHSHLGGSMSDDFYGAVAMMGGLVQDCVISNNAATSRCGGLYLGYGSPIVERTVICNNKATAGNNNLTAAGGVMIEAPGGELRSCLIVSNSLSTAAFSGVRAGGMHLTKGRAVNCTVAGNASRQSGKAAGVYVASAGSLVNSIVYGNGGVDGELNVKVQTPTTEKVYNNLFPETDQVTTEGANNLTGADVDPGFRNSAAHDYRIRPSSVAVNAGVNEDWMADALDLAGNARVNSRIVDLGAYELVVKGLSIIVR